MFVVRDFDSHTRKIEEKNQYSLNSIHSTAQLNSIVKYRLIFFLFSTIRNRMELIFSIQNILGSTSNLPDIINMLEFLMLFHFRIYRFFRNFPLSLSLSPIRFILSHQRLKNFYVLLFSLIFQFSSCLFCMIFSY